MKGGTYLLTKFAQGVKTWERSNIMERKLGRNEPCWCGSGKKYKHCHWEQDQRSQRSTSSPAPLSFPAPEPSPPESPERSAANARWKRFKEADLEGRISLSLETLEAGQLDSEEAFEMLSAIRSGLDTMGNAAHRARYAALVQQLREEAPDLYQEDILSYHQDFITDAIAKGRWEDLPELLAPFPELPGRGEETIFKVVDQLMYHGQSELLREMMLRAWPRVSEGGIFTPWAVEEFAGILAHLLLLDYLEKAETPRPDDPVLLGAVEPYVEFNSVWLEQAVRCLTAPEPSPWTPADFGPAVDAEQLENNFSTLLLEFLADQERAGVPLSRGLLVYAPLTQLLHDQLLLPTQATRKPPARGKKRGRRKRLPSSPPSPLIPRREPLEQALFQFFPFLAPQPYKAGAMMECIPAYLHFLARLNLIHPTEMDQALTALRPLNRDLLALLQKTSKDPLLMSNLQETWSEETPTALREDPALAEARARPPIAPEPQPEPPGVGDRDVCRFKVTYLHDPKVWRVIDILGRQTLDDLHYAIQKAVDFDADHLYSFYLSGRAWDQATEYASPYAKGPDASKVKIRDLPLRLKQKFLYLFDYGAEHHFEVQLMDIIPNAPQKVRYPRIVERHGKNPPQYEWWDEGEDEEEWEEEA